MSIPHQQEINCPNCGTPISFTLWDSINTMIPNAISDIISGKLFDIECDKCGYKTRVDYPILFNDMVHHVMIYYIHSDQMEDTIRTASIMRMIGSEVRIVTSQNELREKAMIFNSGLDDRVIEIVKLLTLEELGDQLQGRNVDAIYFDKRDAAYCFTLIMDGQHASVGINIDSVNTLADTMKQSLAETTQEYVVDRDWAERFLSAL